MKTSEMIDELEKSLRSLAEHKAGIAAAEARVKGLKELLAAQYESKTAPLPHANGESKEKRNAPDFGRAIRALEFVRAKGGVATILEFSRFDKCERHIAAACMSRIARLGQLELVSRGRYKLGPNHDKAQ